MAPMIKLGVCMYLTRHEEWMNCKRVSMFGGLFMGDVVRLCTLFCTFFERKMTRVDNVGY